MFVDLTRLGKVRNLDVVVLPPGYAADRRGYRYNFEQSRWVKGHQPLPDIILRRSGTFRVRPAVVSKDLELFASYGKLHSLPLQCSNKWTFYQILRNYPKARECLPVSLLGTSAQDVWSALERYGDVYVKPLARAQGVSVYRFYRRNDKAVATWEQRVMPRAVERSSRLFRPETKLLVRTFDDTVHFHEFWHTTGLRRCIIQETVCLPHTSDGRPFDFRWLVQDSAFPRVLARVARIGNPNAVTTNIHTGGRAIPALQALQSIGRKHPEEDLDELDRVARLVVKRLEERYGPFAEVGIDMALRPDGRVAVFEVNPTPGRRMLRSIGTDVREMSLIALLEYASRATGVFDGSDH